MTSFLKLLPVSKISSWASQLGLIFPLLFVEVVKGSDCLFKQKEQGCPHGPGFPVAEVDHRETEFCFSNMAVHCHGMQNQESAKT